ncbi:MAG TPA: PEP-utilizing enzyme [Candidatus Norongarragalinales archaeon]|nr:PEP-utilizing enzyme [Candidatus Norongarragalinales archaeon]
MLLEVAHRTQIALSLLRCAKSDEIESVLSGNVTPEDLQRRHRCTVYRSLENGTELLAGKDASEFSNREFPDPEITDASQLIGQCAQPGNASGTVKIIDKAEHMDKMRDGDILVSIATTPEIVPAMKKAAAIVTEIGGITSHAAIVSRELGIPCLIGTKIATKWLKDGDQVEVDATHGVVRKRY